MEELYNVNVNIFFDGHCDWNSPKKNEKQPNLLAYEYSSCNKIHFSYFLVFWLLNLGSLSTTTPWQYPTRDALLYSTLDMIL
jgi:hypothetical protein